VISLLEGIMNMEEGIPEFLRRTRGGNTAHTFESKQPEIIWRKREDKPKKVTAPERIASGTREKASDLCAEINGYFDDWYLEGSEAFLNPYEWLRARDVSAPVAKLILDRYSRELEELINPDRCPQIKEAYASFAKEDLAEMIGFWQRLVDDINQYLGNKKAATSAKLRGPKGPRAIKPEKKVARLQYQREDREMKLISIAPERIIGAQELWTYNTKYKHLTQYKARGRSGLMVKGTTIQDFDVENSITKVLRKPEEIIIEVLRLRNRDKILPAIKTKAIAPSGRINENTILLRVG
jgi:hypothetical protein